MVGAHVKEVAVGGDIHKPVNVFIAAVVVVEIRGADSVEGEVVVLAVDNHW